MKRWWIAPSVLFALWLGCGRASVPESLAGMQASCVVVVVDAASAGHAHPYGYGRETTPTLDRLAASGVLFERAYSQAPSTVLSVPSYMTGLQPHVIAQRYREHHDGSMTYLPQVFAAAGFRTAGFSQNLNVGLSVPGRRIFDHFDGYSPGQERRATPPAGELVARALRWIDSDPDRRFFLYVHLLPPHAPYEPPPAHRLFEDRAYAGPVVPDVAGMAAVDQGRVALSDADAAFIVDRYDANLHFADALLGRLLEGLEERGWLDRTAVVVMSDHGEAFGQHGRYLHNTTLYDEMIRVPLVFRLPPGLGVTGRRVREPVALVDVGPTLEALFELGGRLSAQSAGVPLVASVVSGAEPRARALYSQTSSQVAIVRDGWKLVVSSTPDSESEELYELSADPRERVDLRSTHEDRRRALRSAIDQFRERRIERLGLEALADELPEDVTRQLEALGYLLEAGAAPPDGDPPR